MIDHNHFICHFIFGGHLLNIPNMTKQLWGKISRAVFLCPPKRLSVSSKTL